MADAFTASSILAVLASGAFPTWQSPTVVLAGGTDMGPPTTSGSGAALGLSGGYSAIRTGLDVRLRVDPARRTVVVSPTAVNGTTYRITLDGINCDFVDVASTLAQILAGLAAAIAAAAPGVYTTTVDATSITIKGVGSADYTVKTSIVAGGGTIPITAADPMFATVSVWVYRNAEWVLPDGGVVGAIDYRGWAENIDTSGGIERVYVQLSEVGGIGEDPGLTPYKPTIRIGPCGTGS